MSKMSFFSSALKPIAFLMENKVVRFLDVKVSKLAHSLVNFRSKSAHREVFWTRKITEKYKLRVPKWPLLGPKWPWGFFCSKPGVLPGFLLQTGLFYLVFGSKTGLFYLILAPKKNRVIWPENGLLGQKRVIWPEKNQNVYAWHPGHPLPLHVPQRRVHRRRLHPRVTARRLHHTAESTGRKCSPG